MKVFQVFAYQLSAGLIAAYIRILPYAPSYEGETDIPVFVEGSIGIDLSAKYRLSADYDIGILTMSYLGQFFGF